MKPIGNCLAPLLGLLALLPAVGEDAAVPQRRPSAAERWSETEVGGVPEFERHVLPLLGRAGCSNRACHGSFQGQNGFRLSLFGSDPAADRRALVEEESSEADGPRVNLASPEKSLALLKPTLQVDHGGERRFEAGGWRHRLLLAWIKAGAPYNPQRDSHVTRLEISPTELLLTPNDAPPPLRLTAHFSDGTQEDVTLLTTFDSRDESVARVSDTGRVSAALPGNTAVIATYGGEVASCQVLVPRPDDGVAFPGYRPNNPLDEIVGRRLARLNIRPSPLASDEVFLRRAYLDVIGTLPTPDEVRSFLADRRCDKRDRLIDELLTRPEYAQYWGMIFSDITGNQGINPHFQVSHLWQSWLEDKLARNVPYDELVGGILTATSLEGRPREALLKEIEQVRTNIGSDAEEPYRAQNGRYDKGVYAQRKTLDLYWLRIPNRKADRVALQTAASFLGVRLDCAQCHKHPFDRWTQRDFEQFQSLFRFVEYRHAVDGGPLPRKGRIAYGRDEIVVGLSDREKNQVEQNPPKLLGGEEVPYDQGQDPREALWQWMRSADNPYFAPSLVNRIWAHYFGVGIVEPVEDFSSGNPPSNPELLAWLARDFVEHGFDLKRLHRTILTSRTYQLSWEPNDSNRYDLRSYSHAQLRRMPAEVLVHALGTASGVPFQFRYAPPGAAAIEYAPTLNMPYPLELFGRGIRKQTCGNCERTDKPSLNQALYLMTDGEVVDRMSVSAGRLKQLIDNEDDAAVVEELYFAALSRPPTDTERNEVLQYRAECESRAAWLEDLLWSLVNVREFVFIH